MKRYSRTSCVKAQPVPNMDICFGGIPQQMPPGARRRVALIPRENCRWRVRPEASTSRDRTSPAGIDTISGFRAADARTCGKPLLLDSSNRRFARAAPPRMWSPELLGGAAGEAVTSGRGPTRCPDSGNPRSRGPLRERLHTVIVADRDIG